jgi:quinol monooxygenase YgiN
VIALLWQFEVKPGKQGEFEAFYGADGAWTTLSRKSRSYLGSSFLRDLADTRRYLVAEYWSEMVVYEKHHSTFEVELQILERQRDELVESGQPLGLFNALDVPDRAGPTWSQRSGRVD